MARLKLPCDRLPATGHSTLRKIRVNAISPGMVPTPGYDQFGFSEEQAKEFVEEPLKIFHWDELARPTDRQSCCLSLPMTAAL